MSTDHRGKETATMNTDKTDFDKLITGTTRPQRRNNQKNSGTALRHGSWARVWGRESPSGVQGQSPYGIWGDVPRS